MCVLSGDFLCVQNGEKEKVEARCGCGPLALVQGADTDKLRLVRQGSLLPLYTFLSPAFSQLSSGFLFSLPLLAPICLCLFFLYCHKFELPLTLTNLIPPPVCMSQCSSFLSHRSLIHILVIWLCLSMLHLLILQSAHLTSPSGCLDYQVVILTQQLNLVEKAVGRPLCRGLPLSTL